MPLTMQQVKEIESKSDSYGCGAWDCVACYPLEYACDFCEDRLDTPILNGQQVYCDSCGGLTNEGRKPNADQLWLWAKYVPQRGDNEILDTP
jgi:hypothetical protein